MRSPKKRNRRSTREQRVLAFYDLVTDSHEDTDLSAQYPEIVEEMKAIIKREHTSSNISQFNSITLPK